MHHRMYESKNQKEKKNNDNNTKNWNLVYHRSNFPVTLCIFAGSITASFFVIAATSNWNQKKGILASAWNYTGYSANSWKQLCCDFITLCCSWLTVSLLINNLEFLFIALIWYNPSVSACSLICSSCEEIKRHWEMKNQLNKVLSLLLNNSYELYVSSNSRVCL